MAPSKNNNVYEDRSAIRQALAILEQEGVYLGDNDFDYDFEPPSPPDLNSFMLEDNRSQSKSPKSASRRRNHKQVSPVNFNKLVLPHIPYSKFAEDSSVSSDSVSGSSRSDISREVGGKAKRRNSPKVRSRRNVQEAQAQAHAQIMTDDEDDEESEEEPVKSVQFSNYDHTVFIPHILDFTQEEIEKCWMDEEDYRSIRSRSLTLIEMMEDEKKYPISADYMIVNKHLVCVRGLGEKTSQCTRELERVQRKLYKTLFRVQEELREQGLVDPEAIRQASKKYSKKSTKTARFVGISDEVNVASKFG